MGFEAHVDRILADADRNLDGWYFWEDGLNVTDHAVGQRIADILNESGELEGYATVDKVALQVVFRRG